MASVASQSLEGRVELRIAVMTTAVILAAVSCGGSSSDVVIERQFDEQSNESFTATGDGICAGGTVDGVKNDFGEDGFFFENVFVCADGSGSFVVRVEGDASRPEDLENGTWTFVSGGGDYSDLSGEGNYQLASDPCCTETYTGKLESG